MSTAVVTHPLQWLRQRDRDLAALRRAGRAAIVMPAMFAHRRPGDRQSRGGDVRGVRLVRDAAAGRLRRPDARAAAGPGGARAGRLRVRLPRHAGLPGRLAGGRGDGGGRLRGDLRRRRQLGAGGRHHVAAARLHPAGDARRAPSSIPDRVAGWGMASGAALLAIGCCGRRPRATRCERPRRTPAGRWRRGCARRSPTR